MRPDFAISSDPTLVHLRQTDTVNISLDIRSLIGAFDTLVYQGKIVVDHHINLKDIDPSGDDIRGNQNLKVQFLLHFADIIEEQTFSRPSRNRSIIASRSAASLAPCKEATL